MNFEKCLEVFAAIERDGLESYAKSLTPSDKVKLLRFLEVVNSQRGVEDAEITMNDRYNVYTDLLSMSLSQFIYLEHEIQHGLSISLASLFIRPKDEESFDNTQDYEEAHINSLLSEDGIQIMSLFQKLKANREFILFTKFSGVIYNRIEPIEGEEDEDEIEDNEFSKRWFWYSIVRRLAREDITRFNEIYDLKVGNVLVELAYMAQVAEMEENQRRVEEARNAARYR